MLNQKTPCPGPIVAAAVLLIVIGVQLLLGCVTVAVLLLINDELPAFSCCFAWTVLLPLFLVAELMKVGINSLRGTEEAVFENGCRIQAFGAFAVAFAIFASLYLASTLKLGEGFWDNLYRFFLYSIPIWFNACALLGAGVLLQKSADKYSAWQQENKRLLQDKDYEPES